MGAYGASTPRVLSWWPCVQVIYTTRRCKFGNRRKRFGFIWHACGQLIQGWEIPPPTLHVWTLPATAPSNTGHDIPLSTEGTFLSGSAQGGTIRAARVASLHAARAARAQRKQHTHNAHNAQNAQHGVLEADLEADFRHGQNA